MNRIPFSGRIISVTGETVYRQVSGWFVVRQRGAFSSWGGEFIVESGESPNLSEDVFVLVAESGRRLGFIVVLRSDSGVTEFMGTASYSMPDP
jgi:hypothetical protein